MTGVFLFRNNVLVYTGQVAVAEATNCDFELFLRSTSHQT